MNFKYPERFKPYIKSMENSPIEYNGQTIGWHSGIIGSDGEPLGGGTAESIELSKRIAIAESMEKLEMLYGLTKQEKIDLQFEKYPTRCGLAVGFEKNKTFYRSISEAIERWAWSIWVDEQFGMPRILKPKIQPLGQFVLQQFEEVRFFEKIVTHSIHDYPLKIRFCAVVAIKNNGAYPGSRVCTFNEDPWDHSLIEALRNVQIVQTIHNRKRIYPFLSERMLFFSKNAEKAIDAISGDPYREWPNPEIDFQIDLDRTSSNYFLVRSLCRGFTPWHQGEKSRFVF